MALDDGDVIALIESEEAIAYGIDDTALADERADAVKYYLGELYGNEIEGRSQVVTTEVSDTIESALPQLLKIFTSGDQVVSFKPKNEEDIPASEQESEYINHVVMEKNPGYKIFYTWFKDALLQKNGYLKVYYENETETEKEFYQGLTDGQIQMLASDSRVEIVEHTSYPDPQAQQQIEQAMQQAMMQGADPSQMQMPPVPQLHDVRIEVSDEKGKICIENVPPENMRVSIDTKDTSMQESRFVQHSEVMTREELEEMGFKVPENLGFTETHYFDEESRARNLYSENYDQTQINQILVKDTYIVIEGKRWRYVVAGNTVLHKEEVEMIPFVSITPMLMPHRHIGRSYADLTRSDQLVSSTLLRGMLDAMYLANSPRFAISDRVNLQDMLVSRPGGLVRVQGDPSGAIMPLLAQPANPVTFNLIEMLNNNREKRTGVTAYNQGLDSESLNKTATGISIITNAAQERLLNVARLFAETGIKELFMLVHRLVRMNYTKPDIVRLRNKWVEVDPREWKNRNDLTVSVGLGAGNKDQQLGHLMQILAVQEKALMVGIATPQNIYHTCLQLAQNAGFKDAEKFWTNPEEAQQQPQQPQQPHPEQIKAQADAQKTQMQLQAEQQKFQAQTQIEAQKSQLEMQMEQYRIEKENEFNAWKAKLDSETKLAVAELQSKTSIMTSKMAANSATMDSHTEELDEMGNPIVKPTLDNLIQVVNSGLTTFLQNWHLPPESELYLPRKNPLRPKWQQQGKTRRLY